MRLPIIVAALLAFSCDPINNITVAFPVAPPAHVTAWWVDTHESRAYPYNRVFEGEVATAAFTVTRQECCGNAAAYRNHALHFLACVARSGGDLVLLCGQPGDPPATFVRSTAKGATCADLHVEAMDVALASCTLIPRPNATP